jgi:hypothetical protein
MAYVPAKMIESILRDEGVDIDGYNVIQNIDIDYLAEAERLGMDDGITEGFEFSSQYPMKGVTLTFYGDIIEDYRKISPDQEVPYYYPHLDSCKIEKGDEVEKFIAVDVYWKV